MHNQSGRNAQLLLSPSESKCHTTLLRNDDNNSNLLQCCYLCSIPPFGGGKEYKSEGATDA